MQWKNVFKIHVETTQTTANLLRETACKQLLLSMTAKISRIQKL